MNSIGETKMMLLGRTGINWSYSIGSIERVADRIEVFASISFTLKDREMIYEGRGSCPLMMGDEGIVKAEAEAFDAAADALLSAHQEGWETDRPQQQTRRRDDEEHPITAKQRRMIHALAGGLGIDARAECALVLNNRISKLSVEQASQFIEHLKRLQEKS